LTEQRIIHDALVARACADPKVENELRFVYNDLNNPDLAKVREKTGDPNWLPAKYDMDGWRKSTPRTRAAQPFTHFGPEDLGYGGEEVNHELTTEAFRAYGANPNYFKTVAPNAAKAIRQIWNRHPVASKVLKFNSVAGAAGAPAAWRALGDEQQTKDAPATARASRSGSMSDTT
jgi:hypothetical protein